MRKKLVNFFELVNEISTLASSLEFQTMEDKNIYEIQVKAKGRSPSLLSSLRGIYDKIDHIYPQENTTIDSIKEDVDEWINHLEKEYSIKSKWFKEPEGLRSDDAKKLNKDITKWMKKMHVITDSQHITEKNENKQKIPVILTKDLKKNTKNDLNDAVNCMDYGLYTPAYMLLLRVAEEEVKIFYEKITGTKPPSGRDSAWGNLLNELTVNHKRKFSREITNILFNLLPKRNEAQHPGKRFKKDDCEEIFNYLLVLKKAILKNRSS